MAAPTLTQLKDALVANLQTIDGLQAFRHPVGEPTPPFAWVIRDKTEWHVTGQSGTVCYTFLVAVAVVLASSDNAQDVLDEYLSAGGDKSVYAALESDDSLGGLVDHGGLNVRETSQDEVLTRAQGTSQAVYLGAEFTVEVYAPGK